MRDNLDDVRGIGLSTALVAVKSPVTATIMAIQASYYVFWRLWQEGYIPTWINWGTVYDKSLLSVEAMKDGRYYTLFTCYLFSQDLTWVIFSLVAVGLFYSAVERQLGSVWTLVIALLASAVPSGTFLAVSQYVMTNYGHLPTSLQWLIDHLRVGHQTYNYTWIDGYGSPHELPWIVVPLWALGTIVAVLTAPRQKILWYLAAATAAYVLYFSPVFSGGQQLVFDEQGNPLMITAHHAWDGYVATALVGCIVGVLAHWRAWTRDRAYKVATWGQHSCSFTR